MIDSLSDIPSVQMHVDLAQFTTWNIGGSAEYYWEAKRNLLPDIFRYCNDKNIPTHIIGRGSNILIDDKGLSGLVISTSCLTDLEIHDDSLIAGAGVPMPVIAQHMANHGYSGYKFLIGIPGSIGGGIAMNAGLAAQGRQEIKDILKKATVIYPDGSLGVESADDLSMKFRSTNIHDRNIFVLSGEFDLKKEKDVEKIKEKSHEILESRKQKQPLQYPTAGSVFKNPINGKSAGWYLDKAGLKGRTIGDAKVSEEHANWIINTGNASSTDVFKLMTIMRDEVENVFNVLLEPEVIIFCEDE